MPTKKKAKPSTQKLPESPFIKMPSDKSLITTSDSVKFSKERVKSQKNQSQKRLCLDYGDKPPNHFPFDTYEAYRIRVISFANGAIYAITNDKAMSEDEKKQKISVIKLVTKDHEKRLDAFKEKMQGQPQAPDFNAELDQFYSKELPIASGLKPKQIALGEAMYVWQEMPRQPRVTRYQKDLGAGKGHLVVEQIETPRSSKLTEAQKQELCGNNLKDNPPKWFSKLDPWAQNALFNIVPSEPNGDWSKYKKCHPTILRQIPGEANATKHELIVKRVFLDENGKNKEEIVSHTVSRRQGAPTSFDMKSSKERQHSANETLQQMLDSEMKSARKKFNEKWGLPLETPMPILLGGLVTVSEQANLLGKFVDATNLSGAQNNTRLAREKETAVAQYEKKYSGEHGPIRLFNLNVAVDALRSATPVKPDNDFVTFAENFHKQVMQAHKNDAGFRQRCSQLAVPANEMEINLAKLYAAKKALEELHDLPPNDPKLKGRNSNLYLAATYDVMTRAMGGLSTGNCKSSKDRKGMEFMMADAMEIYFAEQIAKGEKPEFPQFNDQGEKRERFVQIFCELYASGHQLLVAHDNSPGCPGIKAGNTLDADIVQGLKKMKGSFPQPSQETKKDHNNVYAQSKEAADFNKPGTFWKKHRKKIEKGSRFLAAALGVVAIGLMASVIFAPVGVGVGILAGAIASIPAMGDKYQASLADQKMFGVQGEKIDSSPKPKIEEKLPSLSTSTSDRSTSSSQIMKDMGVSREQAKTLRQQTIDSKLEMASNDREFKKEPEIEYKIEQPVKAKKEAPLRQSEPQMASNAKEFKPETGKSEIELQSVKAKVLKQSGPQIASNDNEFKAEPRRMVR